MRNYILAIALAVLAACTSEKQYKIGVSQCSQEDQKSTLGDIQITANTQQQK